MDSKSYQDKVMLPYPLNTICQSRCLHQPEITYQISPSYMENNKIEVLMFSAN